MSDSRRTFLERLLGASAASALVPLGSGRPGAVDQPARPPAPPTGDEQYWADLKRQFVFPANQIPMNSANMCPAPRTVVEAVERATRDVDADVSYQNRAKYNALRESARARVGTLLGVTADEIAIVRNASEANNIVVGGIALGKGDEVVLLDQNHPTNNVAWDVRAARFGFTVKRVGLATPPTSVAQVVAAMVGAMTDRTRVLAFSDVSNATGLAMPTAELCRIGRARGMYVHVDGAQTFGATRRNLRELGCDSYSASAQKFLMGPREIGILYVRGTLEKFKGTRFEPSYHRSTPDSVWDILDQYLQISDRKLINPKMFNSFVDGTKSGIEMTAICNATGLVPQTNGLTFPPASRFERLAARRSLVLFDGGLPAADGQAGVLALEFSSAGERLIVGSRDVDMPSGTHWLPMERVTEAGAVLADVRWLEGARAAFEAARLNGVPTVLDADLGAREALSGLLKLTDYAIFSAPALREFAAGTSDVERLDHILSFGVKHAGVTLGSEGYTWRERGSGGQIPAFSVSVTDTTGAGDAFHGTFALMLAEGVAVGQRARMAAAAAALKCRRLGSRAGLPSRSELESFQAGSASGG